MPKVADAIRDTSRRAIRSGLTVLTVLAGLACVACCAIPALLAAGVIGGAGWIAVGQFVPGAAVLSVTAAALAWWTSRRRGGSRRVPD